jgi:hypothetical protein
VQDISQDNAYRKIPMDHGCTPSPLPSKEVLETARLIPIQEYIKQRKNARKTYIQTRPIYQKCINSKPLARNAVWWLVA